MATEGTHMGRIDDDQRKRRRAKNARNAARSGTGARKGCYAIAVENGADPKVGCGHRGHGFVARRAGR